MAFDFKKAYKALYMPQNVPELITVPPANYIAVRGHGDPNEEGGAYKQAIEILYSVAYTLKMSYKTEHQIEGFFEYVVPPLEGFWWQEGINGMDYEQKEKLAFISCLRVPDYVTPAVFDWAVKEATAKKELDFSRVNLQVLTEGKCVQVLHRGPFDDEPATVSKLQQFIEQNNLQLDYSDQRHHHEIYLSDPRRTKVENLKTVIRLPVS